MGKYNFDEVVNRESTYSMKWRRNGWTAQLFGGTVPEDRICLQVADMDFKCSPQIVAAMHKIADEAIYGYSGIPDEYYEAVVSWYKRRMDWSFNNDDIFYAPGTHKAISDCLKKFTKENEGVIVLTPSYSYHWDIEPNKRAFVPVDMINNDGYYTIDFEALENACKDPNNTSIIICNPHNPTGRVYNEEELIKMAEICRKHNVLMISDEVHSDLIRKGVKFYPMMKVVGPEGLIVTTAVNKTFNLAGLQMTNVIVQDPKLKEAYKMDFTSPTPFGIASVIAAYNESEDWVDELNEYLDALVSDAVDFIHENMPKCKVFKPEGSYILWLDFSGYNLTDEELRQKIYTNARVVAQGGTNYDEHKKEQFQRLCIASPRSMVMEGLARIAKEFND